MSSVKKWFIFFLYATDNTIKNAVKAYNYGGLSTNARLALEMIDGCDGPGDAISTP